MDRSSRGQVYPFIVMDMAAEATGLKALGHRVIHMAVSQRSTPAPQDASAALLARMASGQSHPDSQRALLPKRTFQPPCRPIAVPRFDLIPA